MTDANWFVIGRDAIMLLITALVFYWGMDRKRTEQLLDQRFQRATESLAQDFALRDQRLDVVEQQIERASARSSEHTGRVTAKIAELSERIAVMEEHTRGRDR